MGALETSMAGLGCTKGRARPSWEGVIRAAKITGVQICKYISLGRG